MPKAVGTDNRTPCDNVSRYGEGKINMAASLTELSRGSGVLTDGVLLFHMCVFGQLGGNFQESPLFSHIFPTE